MPRVLAICRDVVFCQKLVQALESESDFAVSVHAENNIDMTTLCRDVHPDLLILEASISPALLAMVAALKSATPETPLFLITDHPNMWSEKEALAHGVDAVFAKSSNFLSLVMNARAICGHH